MPRFRDEPISPLLGSTLMEILRDDLHHGLVDLAVLVGVGAHAHHPAAGGGGQFGGLHVGQATAEGADGRTNSRKNNDVAGAHGGNSG